MVRRLGLEEELLLVHPETLEVVAVAPRALRAHESSEPGAELEPELYQQQIELATEPATSLDDLVSSLRRARAEVVAAAEAAGARAVAVPTPVLPGGAVRTTGKDRYHRIVEEYGALARQALVGGMHVHVDVTDDEEALAVVDGIRPWLPVLLAISANSPYWHGEDTGHASWRSQVWGRWPTGGPREPFGDLDSYRETARLAQEWGAALDPGMLYYDVRLATDLPTVELRVADVCTEVDDALLVAALSRGLVETVARAHAERGRDDRPPPEATWWRTDLLRAAHWRAARSGMAGSLVHPLRRALAPAATVVEDLVAHTSEALDEAGDLETVRRLLGELVSRGPGATRQRAVFEGSGDLRAVVADLAHRTAAG